MPKLQTYCSIYCSKYCSIFLTLFFYGVVSLCAADTEPPEVTIEDDGCGNYIVHVTDVGAGVYNAPSLKNSAVYNMSEISLSDDFQAGQANYDFHFSFYVQDLSDSAGMAFYVYDTEAIHTGNPVYKEIEYVPNLATVQPNKRAMVNIVVGDTVMFAVDFKNDDTPIYITNVFLHQNKSFHLVTPTKQNYLLGANATENIGLYYAPEVVSIEDDTLEIQTNCPNISFYFYVSGQSINPVIQVEDYDYGVLNYGSVTACSDLAHNPTLDIKNIGVGLLNIKKYSIKKGTSFEMDFPDKSNLFDKNIASGASYGISSLICKADKVGKLIDTLVLTSNAKGIDSIAVLTAYVLPPGGYLTAYSFKDRRVHSYDTAMVYIRNNSTQVVYCSDISVSGDSDQIYPLYDQISPVLGEPLALYPENNPPGVGITEIKIPVVFAPKHEGKFRIDIALSAKDSKGKNVTGVYNSVFATGVQPKAFAVGYTFEKQIAIGDTAIVRGQIIVKNISTLAPLAIKSISRINPANPAYGAFLFDGITMETKIGVGDSLVLPVRFSPAVVGENKLELRVRTDAYELPTTMLFQDTVISLTGMGYKKPLDINSIVFPTTNYCLSATDTFRCVNMSSHDVLIDSIVVSGISPEAFVFDTTLSEIKEIIVGDTLAIGVDYLPILSDMYLPSAVIAVYYEGIKQTASLYGTTYKTGVLVTVDSLFNLHPGLLVFRGSATGNIGISVKIQDYISQPIDEIEIEFRFQRDEIRYLDEIAVAGFGSEVTITTRFVAVDEDTASLWINLKHAAFFENDFTLYPKLETLLSKAKISFLEIEAIKLNKECFAIETRDGVITYNYCGVESHGLLFTNADLHIIDIAPNPAIGSTVSIHFTVPFNLRATLDIYNSLGKLLLSAFDGEITMGEHTFEIDISDLRAGIYTVRLNQGAFSTDKRFVIYR